MELGEPLIGGTTANPQREVPDVCHSLLEKMKDFAEKIYEKFPVEYSAE